MGTAFIAVRIKVYQSNLPAEVYVLHHFKLKDSMPIVMAKQGRIFEAKAAPKIADSRGYCAVTKRDYYSLKLHIVRTFYKGRLSIQEYIGVNHV